MNLQTSVNTFFSYVYKKSTYVTISNWNINLSTVGGQQQNHWKTCSGIKGASYPYGIEIY